MAYGHDGTRDNDDARWGVRQGAPMCIGRLERTWPGEMGDIAERNGQRPQTAEKVSSPSFSTLHIYPRHPFYDGRTSRSISFASLSEMPGRW